MEAGNIAPIYFTGAFVTFIAIICFSVDGPIDFDVLSPREIILKVSFLLLIIATWFLSIPIYFIKVLVTDKW